MVLVKVEWRPDMRSNGEEHAYASFENPQSEPNAFERPNKVADRDRIHLKRMMRFHPEGLVRHLQ